MLSPLSSLFAFLPCQLCEPSNSLLELPLRGQKRPQSVLFLCETTYFCGGKVTCVRSLLPNYSLVPIQSSTAQPFCVLASHGCYSSFFIILMHQFEPPAASLHPDTSRSTFSALAFRCIAPALLFSAAMPAASCEASPGAALPSGDKVDEFFQVLEQRLPFPAEALERLVQPELLQHWKDLGATQSVAWPWVMSCELSLVSFLTSNARLAYLAEGTQFLQWLQADFSVNKAIARQLSPAMTRGCVCLTPNNRGCPAQLYTTFCEVVLFATKVLHNVEPSRWIAARDRNESAQPALSICLSCDYVHACQSTPHDHSFSDIHCSASMVACCADLYTVTVDCIQTPHLATTPFVSASFLPADRLAAIFNPAWCPVIPGHFALHSNGFLGSPFVASRATSSGYPGSVLRCV